MNKPYSVKRYGPDQVYVGNQYFESIDFAMVCAREWVKTTGGYADVFLWKPTHVGRIGEVADGGELESSDTEQ